MLVGARQSRPRACAFGRPCPTERGAPRRTRSRSSGCGFDPCSAASSWHEPDGDDGVPWEAFVRVVDALEQPGRGNGTEFERVLVDDGDGWGERVGHREVAEADERD